MITIIVHANYADPCGERHDGKETGSVKDFEVGR